MATNIDKALFQQPAGLDELAQEQEPIEIEIVDPEAVHIDAGDVEIDIEKGEPSIEDFDANLAKYLDDSEIDSMASELASDIDNEKNIAQQAVHRLVVVVE